MSPAERIAAAATLSPRVRVALEAALEEDDEQLTRSFTELTAMAPEEPAG